MPKTISAEKIERMEWLININLEKQLSETLHGLCGDLWDEDFDLSNIESFLKIKCEKIIKEFTE